MWAGGDIGANTLQCLNSYGHVQYPDASYQQTQWRSYQAVQDTFKETYCEVPQPSLDNAETSLTNRQKKKLLYGQGSGRRNTTLSLDNAETSLTSRQKKKLLYGQGSGRWNTTLCSHAAPVTSAYSTKIMRDMGWQYGQSLGRKGEGHTQPIAPIMKKGRRGLCTRDENKSKFQGAPEMIESVKKSVPVELINGKHPVSLLAEQCTKRGVAMPNYEILYDRGFGSTQNVLTKVIVDGTSYQPKLPSPYNKHAKSAAASLALRELGWDIVEVKSEESQTVTDASGNVAVKSRVNLNAAVKNKDEEGAATQATGSSSKVTEDNKASTGVSTTSSASTTVELIQDKHPVSLLIELCVKKKLPQPEFLFDSVVVDEPIPVKVTVARKTFELPNSSFTKKREAKAACATYALKQLGWITDDKNVQQQSQRTQPNRNMFVRGGLLNS